MTVPVASTLRCLPWALALAGLCAPAYAQDDERAAELPTVTVLGERTQLQDSGVVIRVPVQPLGAADTGELLASLPGVQVRTAGGFGSYSEASLRGSSAQQVRVLLDGLPLDTGGGESTSLSLISPLLLEEVEVYKGRVPATLGAGLAGTINLRSRRELVAPLTGSASIGSFGVYQVDLAAQPAHSVQIAAGGQGADNDFDYINAYKAYDPTDPDRTRPEPRQNAGTQQRYALLRYFGAVDVTAHVLDDTQELPTRANSPESSAEFQTQSYALSLTTPDDGRDWQGVLSHRYTRETYRDPDSQIGLGEQETQSDTHRTLASLGKRFGSQLQDTFSAEHTDYRASDRFGNLPTAEAQRLALRNGIDAQTRGEKRRYNASLQLAWSTEEADHAGSEDHWLVEPAVGVSQRWNACQLAGNLGRRERLPTFFERYGDRGLFRGNPSLQPEKAVYTDVGARCQPGERLQRLELSAFGQELRDAISPTYNAQGVGRSINTEKALIYGVEADSALRFGNWGLQLGGTWQHTEDRSQVVATRGQQLPGRFETQLNARIERRWLGLGWHYAYRLEAGQFYDSTGLLPAPTAQRHDIGVRGSLRRVGWALQVLDLTDQQYQQFNGYPTPGRRALLSFTYPASPSSKPSKDTP